MTNEQAERVIQELERIADSLQGLSDLAMPREQMEGMIRLGKRDEVPVVVRALNAIAEYFGSRA